LTELARPILPIYLLKHTYLTMKFLKNFYDWAKRVVKWIRCGWLFWLYILLIVVLSFLKCFYVYTGVLLQLLGIVTILIGINNKIRLFNNIKPLKFHFGYFSQFPHWKVKDVKVQIAGISTATSICDATIRSATKKPDNSFADIIRYIDEKFEVFYNDLSSTRTEIYNDLNLLSKKITNQQQLVDAKINTIENKLITSNISGVSLELFGAACVAAGLVFSILPYIFS
jgi:hypothetical protein